ncbi:MAG: DEAD/DEAH box helicase [Planctomycetota bacterium]
MSKQDCVAGHDVEGKGGVEGKGPAVGSASPAVFSGLRLENRAYQARIVEKCLGMFEGTHRDRWGEAERAAHSVLVESPTGSGKTIMGLEIARQLQHRFGYSVGWASMRRNLLVQAKQENERRGFAVDLRLISMFDKHPPKVDVLVVDEAQHDAAASMANLHSTIRPRYVLGMTATPFRTDRIKLCFDRIIKDAGIHQLIQDGFLSRYHHFTIRRYSPASVAECYLREPERWGKSLIFFHRLVQCNECCERLTRGGARAEVVTARTDRQRQIAEFSEGKIDVLLNMAILTEGFDCPSLKTVFCRPSGRACTIQMAGRVFRKCVETPFKQIVQCNNTRHPFVKTALADEQYAWSEEGWQTLKLNRHITAISDVARRAIAAVDVKLPPVVANQRRRSLPWEAREETFQL